MEREPNAAKTFTKHHDPRRSIRANWRLQHAEHNQLYSGAKEPDRVIQCFSG